MFKTLKATKDTYITDRVVNDQRVENANVGQASSLDLFKLYGITSSGSNPNIELSRLLIKFDLDPLRQLYSQGKIDPGNPSFNCTLKLFDVYGGQTVPSNFVVTVNALSKSFDEGIGRDIVLYSDNDVCNFLTASRLTGSWILSGANSGNSAGDFDFYDNYYVNQTFIDGTEDLSVDVTNIVSATLSNTIEDEGFRIAFTSSLETDNRTYFVKRFASRHALDDAYHPRLIVKFDDSIQDDSQNVYFGQNSNIFLYSFLQGGLSNILSGNTEITGSNSLILSMSSQISGGVYNLTFDVSQHTLGIHNVTGVYSATINIPFTNQGVINNFNTSGSVKFTPIWSSLDGTIGYSTGSSIFVKKPTINSSAHLNNDLLVTVTNVKKIYQLNEIARLDVNIFDRYNSNIKVSRIPVNLSGLVFRDVHYQVRCVETNEIIIPFDTTFNSTRISSDINGMFFKLDTSNLTKDRSYNVDIMISTNNEQKIYNNSSSIFKVTNLHT